MSESNGTGQGAQGAGEGGQQQGGQDPAGTAPPNGQQPAQQGAQQPGQQGAQQAQQQGDGEDAAARIARLETELAEARKDAGRSRTTAKQRAADEARAELAKELGKVLGIVDDDTPPDPDQLAKQLADEQAKARQTAVDLAVYRTAPTVGADADALLDSRAFADAIKELDPNDADAIKNAISAAVEANPRLAAQQAPQQQGSGPTRTGAEFRGGGGAEVTPAQFAAMTYAQRQQLYQSDPDTYRRLAGS